MRIGIMATAALLTALPAPAQVPKDVQGPRTLTPWMVACTDLPVTSRPDPRIIITGIRAVDNRGMASRGQEVDINRTPDDGLAVGQRYAVRRLQGDPKAFPRQGEGFGAVRTAGFVTITAIDDRNALANVDLACTAIEAGDYLEAYAEPALPTAATAMATPDWDDRAAILTGTDYKAMFGDGDTLSIDRGTVHGVTTGQRFAIYRDFRNRMPLFYLGDVVVVEPGELTSKAVVVSAVDAMTVDDVAIPRRQR